MYKILYIGSPTMSKKAGQVAEPLVKSSENSNGMNERMAPKSL